MITWELKGGSHLTVKTLECLVDFYHFVVSSCSFVRESDGRKVKGEEEV